MHRSIEHYLEKSDTQLEQTDINSELKIEIAVFDWVMTYNRVWVIIRPQLAQNPFF